MTRRAGVFVLSAPSGAGKHTILHELLARHPELAYAVTATTRSPRPGEVHGRDYYFLSDAEFAARREAGAFAEYAQVHGHWYGTPWAEIGKHRDAGRDVLIQLDVQGRRNLEKIGLEHTSIFIAPPSLAVLEARLRHRGSERPEAMELRLQNASTEMAAQSEYDFVVVNESLEKAVAECESIIQGRRGGDHVKEIEI